MAYLNEMAVQNKFKAVETKGIKSGNDFFTEGDDVIIYLRDSILKGSLEYVNINYDEITFESDDIGELKIDIDDIIKVERV